MGDPAGRKGVKGLWLAGHKEVPRGLRTGDLGDTADAAGDRGRPASRAGTPGRNRESGSATDLYFFSWDAAPLTGQSREGRTVCGCLWVFEGTLRFLRATFRHYSKPV